MRFPGGVPFLVSVLLSAVCARAQEGRVYPEGSERYSKPAPVQGPEPSPGPVTPVEPLPQPAPALRKAAGAAAIAIDVKPASAAVDLYKPLFATITMAVNYANPFDQNDVKVDLAAVSPSGKNITVPCFWKGGTTASSTWEARWTPRETGTFTYRITCVKNGETSSSAEQVLTVNPSNLDGFLHMDSTGSFYHFRFDSGKPFRGVGENFGWEGGKYTFENMFALLKQNGANFVRTWRGPGEFYLEQATGKAGWYQSDTAARVDRTLNQAEQAGIYLMPTLDPVIEYQTGVDGWSGQIKWQQNPYGTYKGGPCNGPLDFFNGQKARDIYKNRLRYAVARWGYSPYVAVWEFFNEVDWANITEHVPTADIAAWHNYMASYLRGIDPYNHIVTTSLSHNDFSDLWSLKNMDFTQRHIYGSMDQLISFQQQYAKYNKPFVSGEFSLDYRGVTQHPAADYGKELHLGIWRGLFMNQPIAPLTWWWDFHADQGQYFHFKYARDLLDKMMADTKSIVNVDAAAPANVEARALKSDRGLFVWLNNKNGSALNNFQVKVNGATSAQGYDWRAYDNWKGTYGAPATAAASNGTVTVTVPALAAYGDMALWFSDKAPVVGAPRRSLPDGFSAVFDPVSARLIVSAPYPTGEPVRWSLADAAGRSLAAGSLSLRGAGTASARVPSASRGTGVRYLRVALGAHSLTRVLPPPAAR
jgi:hypothetical protein